MKNANIHQKIKINKTISRRKLSFNPGILTHDYREKDLREP